MSRKIIACSILLIAILFSCSPYRKITFVKSEAYQKKRVSNNIDRYDIIVHSNDSTYFLTNPTVENGELSGKLKLVEESEAPKLPEIDQKNPPKELKNDLHVYLVEDSPNVSDGKDIKIKDNDVEKSEIFAQNKSGLLGVGLTIFLILGGALLLLIVILLIALVSSIGNSGSDSSGSNSGGSDSGCYIATMAYGSYDAPQVLILRQFRDRFLQKFGAGRAFIAWYYKNSPSFVEKHRSKQWLHKGLRVYLSIFVIALKPFFKLR